jgi:DNA adenine methylase
MPNTPTSAEPAPRDSREHLNRVRPGATGPKAAVEAQPFLKWAGGKSQLLQQFEPFFPAAIRWYSEPFLGGGAVFFHLKARFPKLQATLCDKNEELINCYQVIREEVEALINCLDEHLQNFRTHSRQYYYEVRAQLGLRNSVERAARMIFLNKTCYNGLWRVNGKGQFNVPIGSYKPEKVSLYDRPNLLAASHALRDAELRVQDFRQTLGSAPQGAFVYVDPPYYPLSRTANFTSYTQHDFSPEDQQELAELCASAARRGVRVMLSNSDTPTTRALYAQFAQLRIVQARRSVNCDGAKRGRVSELVALSYN